MSTEQVAAEAPATAPSSSNVSLSSTHPTLKPIDKAGHYGNLTPAQDELLAGFEKKLTEEGALPDPTLEDKEQRTTVLL